MSLLHVVTTGLDPVVNADVRRIKRCGNSSAAGEPHGLPGQLTPKTALRALCPAMTKYKIVLAALSCARALPTTTTPKKIRSRHQRGKRSAERRMPTMSASAQTSVRELASLIRYAAARPFGARPPFGAHACGTRHRLSPRWLSARTGFPADEPRRCFARLAQLSSVKHAPCRPVFLPVDRGPRAARERIGNSARGHRPSLPSFRLALPERRPQ
jgi:hypothetical protein